MVAATHQIDEYRRIDEEKKRQATIHNFPIDTEIVSASLTRPPVWTNEKCFAIDNLCRDFFWISANPRWLVPREKSATTVDNWFD